MRYRIAMFDAERCGERLALADDEDGVAVVIRRRGLPVGFVMRPLRVAAPPDRIEPGESIDDAAAAGLLLAAMRDELPRPQETGAMQRISLTVAICTRDRPALLARCLDSLAALAREDLAALALFEILVVDNAPANDETMCIVTARQGLRYVREARPGLDFARNAALREAKGDLLAYLDDDIIVDAGWLRALCAAALEQPRAALFTGQVLPLELETRAQVLFELRGGFRRGFERVVFGRVHAGDPFFPCSAALLGTGANMVVRREATLRVGGFDEALDTGAPLPGGGDLDMFYRLLRAGQQAVYEPACLVFHQHRREMADLRRQYRDSWGKAFMAFAVKSLLHDPPMRWRWLGYMSWWFIKQLTQLAMSVAGRHARPASLIVAELWGGVLGMFGAYGRSRRRIARTARGVA